MRPVTSMASVPKRLTRQESQAQTRERLLDVAAKEFLKRGYAGTSIDRVSEEAGYSKGAVYSNFGNKEELCMAVLDRHYIQLMMEFTLEFSAAPPDIDARVAVVERWWTKIMEETGWRLLMLEFAFNARDSERLQTELAQRERVMLAALAGFLEHQTKQLGLRSMLASKDLATVLVALAGGLAVQRFIDPQIPAGLLGDAIRALTGTAKSSESSV